MTKAIKKIMAWSLAFVCAATAGIAAIATNGFGLGDPTAQVGQADHNKQLSFGGFFGNGITLKASAEEAATGAEARGYTEYNFKLQAGYYDSTTGEVVEASSNYHVEWCEVNKLLDTESGSSYTAFKLTIATGCIVNMCYEYEDGTYGISNDIAQTVSVSQREFDGVSRVGFNVRGSDQSKVYTIEEAKGAFKILVPYEGAANLIATVNELATDKSVTWSAAWENPSSEWASGKDVEMYVSIVSTADDGLSVAVRRIQAFGERIVITVTSVSNPEVSASCTVDYLSRLLDIEMSTWGELSDTKGESFSLDNPTMLDFTPKYSIGTLSGNYEYSMVFDFSDSFIDALEESGDYQAALAMDSSIKVNRNIELEIDQNGSINLTLSVLCQYYGDGDQLNFLNNAFHKVANEFETQGWVIGTIYLTGSYTHSDLLAVVYEDYHYLYHLSSDECEVAVTSLELDNTTLTL